LTIWTWLSVVGRPAVLGLAIGLGLAACQVVPGDGPIMYGAKSNSTDALPFDLIDLTPASVVAYRTPSTIDRPSNSGRLASPRLTVAPGDALSVRIFEQYEGGTFPTIQNASAADLGAKPVDAAGTIDVAYIGRLKVAGLTTREVEAEILKRLDGKAKNPQVIVDFIADRANTVMVSGDVKVPGQVSLAEGARTVMDAINRAGGLSDAPVAAGAASDAPPADDSSSDSSSSSSSTSTSGANDPKAIYDKPDPPPVGGPTQREVIVRRQGKVVLDKPYAELLAGVDMGLEKGDEIVVRPDFEVVTVLGAVAHAGNVALTKPRMSLAETLGEANGLFDLRANKTGVYVFRMGDIETDPAARARVFRLDLLQPVSLFVAQQFSMRPRDVIFVTNAPLREYDKTLDPIYRTLALRSLLTTVVPSIGN